MAALAPADPEAPVRRARTLAVAGLTPDRPVRLTASDPRAPPPPGFVGALYAPQETLLAAMMSLEAYPFLAGAGREYRVRAARVSAKFSFGKTVLFVALALAPPPANYEFPMAAIPGLGGGYAVVRHRRVYPATLVAAATAVIGQWVAAAARFAPGAALCVVEDRASLDAFAAEHAAGAAHYDIVLVRVARSVSRLGEGGGSTASLLDQVQEAVGGVAWARVVFDDFDSVPLARRVLPPAALFTWYVSATARKRARGDRARVPRPGAAGTALGPLLARAGVIDSGASRALTSGFLDLSCEAGYIDRHLALPPIAYHRVVVPSTRAGRALAGLVEDPALAEILAAGAVQAAAQHLNIEAKGPWDLLRAILDGRAAELEDARAALRELRARAPAADPAAQARAAAREQALEARVAELEARIARARENLTEGGCQGGCFGELLDAEGLYCLSCCQVVICPDCAVDDAAGGGRAMISRCPHCAADIRFAEQAVYISLEGRGDDALEQLGAALEDPRAAKAEAEAAEAAAAEAAAEAAAAAEAEAEAAEAAEDAEAAEAAEAAEDAEAEALLEAVLGPYPLLRHRLGALVRLIRGGLPADQLEPIEVAIPGLIAGRAAPAAPPPEAGGHRYLVFASQSWTTTAAAAVLAALGIPAACVRGRRADRDRAVAEFRAGRARVLLATSSSDCSGLHIPEITRVVFLHNHADPGAAAQGIGRAQRLGRETALEVVVIFDTTEVGQDPLGQNGGA